MGLLFASVGLAGVLFEGATWAGTESPLNHVSLQESFPEPPPDATLIYVSLGGNKIAPLQFESGTTPLSTAGVARSDKISYLQLKGEHAAIETANTLPRFYLFVPDREGVHLPLLVRLAVRKGARRATATTQKGERGFAILSDEIMKPNYRVLKRLNGLLFMEVQGREPLEAGEYAFIGGDLQHIATIHVGF
jgi:hypothetical protein